MEESEEWSSPRKCAITCALQYLHKDTRSFIYADDLCIATQDASFEKTESTLSAELDSIGDYYEKNHLRANPDKTQTCVFHLRNRKANRQLNISWCGNKLEHTPSPIYLGVTLDRTLSYSTHITKVKAKKRLQQETTSWGSLLTRNGEHIHRPSRQQLLLSATPRLNMHAQCGKDQRTHTRLTQCWTMLAAPSQDACNQPTSRTYTSLLVLLLLQLNGVSLPSENERNKWTTTDIHYTATIYQGNALNPETASCMPQTNWSRAHPLADWSSGLSTCNMYPTGYHKPQVSV